jgi:hypothetical protein
VIDLAAPPLVAHAAGSGRGALPIGANKLDSIAHADTCCRNIIRSWERIASVTSISPLPQRGAHGQRACIPACRRRERFRPWMGLGRAAGLLRSFECRRAGLEFPRVEARPVALVSRFLCPLARSVSCRGPCEPYRTPLSGYSISWRDTAGSTSDVPRKVCEAVLPFVNC